jgi:hypothetical protein
MRTTAALSLVLLAAAAAAAATATACGGAPKPAGSAADTSSLEQSQEKQAAGESASPAAASDEPAPKTSADAPASAKPKASAAAAEAPAAAPAPVVHPTPAANGNIDGKPFAPKVARATSAMQKDGRLLLSITEGTECGVTPKPGEGALSVLVEWKDGYKTDVGSLKRATRPGGGEVGFSRTGGGLSKTFKPTGRVTVVSAPTDQNATGKLKVDLQSGEFMLAGDLDVLLCVAAK